MSYPHTPDLLTTHKYLVGATDALGEIRQHNVVHNLTTEVLDATSEIPVPHIIDASVTVPVKGEDPETGSLLLSGARKLTIELRTDDMPKRTGHVPGVSSRYVSGSDSEQRILASAAFSFNTRRILSATGEVWRDGTDMGIDHWGVSEPTRENFLLGYLARLGHMRTFGVRRAAEIVTDISLYGAQSMEQKYTTVDISKVARAIGAATGKAVPPSLQRTPHVESREQRQVAGIKGTPTTGTSTLTVDTLKGPERLERIITSWRMTHYNLFTPTDPPHLAFYEVAQLDREPTGVSFGLDAYQDILTIGSSENGFHRATSDTEARKMVAPYINAVSSLKRYHTVATRGQAA